MKILLVAKIDVFTPVKSDVGIECVRIGIACFTGGMSFSGDTKTHNDPT
jgi:hypothetical protein